MTPEEWDKRFKPIINHTSVVRTLADLELALEDNQRIRFALEAALSEIKRLSGLVGKEPDHA